MADSFLERGHSSARDETDKHRKYQFQVLIAEQGIRFGGVAGCRCNELRWGAARSKNRVNKIRRANVFDAVVSKTRARCSRPLF